MQRIDNQIYTRGEKARVKIDIDENASCSNSSEQASTKTIENRCFAHSADIQHTFKSEMNLMEDRATQAEWKIVNAHSNASVGRREFMWLQHGGAGRDLGPGIR